MLGQKVVGGEKLPKEQRKFLSGWIDSTNLVTTVFGPIQSLSTPYLMLGLALEIGWLPTVQNKSLTTWMNFIGQGIRE
jgi:hypothetical protein